MLKSSVLDVLEIVLMSMEESLGVAWKRIQRGMVEDDFSIWIVKKPPISPSAF